MYGASVVSGHFGDVVLWELSPPAAGEVLVRARTPGRPSAAVVRELGSHMRRIEQRAQQHFAHAYCSTRSDLETSAGGGAEGGGSRPCGGGVILWERALLAWGIRISLGEPASMRAQDENGAPDASTDAGMLPARRSRPPAWPQAATAALKWQRARHNAASIVRNRPTPSGSPESPRAAGARACRRPGGRARRGLAPGSRQPAAGAERSTCRCPRASCAPLWAPAPRLPPAHRIAAVVGKLEKGGSQ